MMIPAPDEKAQAAYHTSDLLWSLIYQWLWMNGKDEGPLPMTRKTPDEFLFTTEDGHVLSILVDVE